MIIARVNTRSGDLGGRRANSGGPRASSVKARRQMPFLHYSRVECAHHSDCDVPPTKESQWKRNNKDGAIGCSACYHMRSVSLACRVHDGLILFSFFHVNVEAAGATTRASNCPVFPDAGVVDDHVARVTTPLSYALIVD
ncbi:hypothetical protein TcWFU_008093 [Taenia crassiceps]|uniref:Uncharacterized protein n=1 Tax=Taenia crassiceps TaxID=6207 RepID=A0ABR4QL86_9CEST